MKPTSYSIFLFVSLFLFTGIRAQDQAGTDSTGLPGDNFSLQGALALFQKAGNPEEFEKLLNSADNHVNNLDLNGDGDIDYIRVTDMMEKDVHVFVLQVPVSEKESQDIAVIELEKTGDANAIVQIIGDEDIYGEEIIVEPGSEEEGAFLYDRENSIAHGPSAEYNTGRPGIIVNVWFWPGVRYVYAPGYATWRSPWRWHHYPGWWRPWRPLSWHAIHPFRRPYYRPYVVVHTHRVIRAHRIYTPVRVTSVTVRTRHAVAVNGYRVNRTKTTVTRPGGNQVTRKTTTVRGKAGNTRARTTKTTVRKRR
jgi:hypothetical protein